MRLSIIAGAVRGSDAIDVTAGAVAAFATRPARDADLAGSRALIQRILSEEFKTEIGPEHEDLVDFEGSYRRTPHAQLFVAIDRASGEVIATAGVRQWSRRHPTHPEWLHRRYLKPTVAELTRVYTAREHRRRGAARALVELARRWVVADGFYTVLMLHTNAGIPGAEPFWRTLAIEIHDSRPTPHNTVHFELPLDRSVADARQLEQGASDA